MKLYVVTKDGCSDPYGSEIYLMGVYDSIEKACTVKGYHKITEVQLNIGYPLLTDNNGNEYNKLYLGGYCE